MSGVGSAIEMEGAGMRSGNWNRQKLEVFEAKFVQEFFFPWLHGEFKLEEGYFGLFTIHPNLHLSPQS